MILESLALERIFFLFRGYIIVGFVEEFGLVPTNRL